MADVDGPEDPNTSDTPSSPRSGAALSDEYSEDEEYTAESFALETSDFGAADIAAAFYTIPLGEISRLPTSRATQLLRHLRERCSSSVPRPGAQGKAVAILKRLRSEKGSLVPDVEDAVEDAGPTATAPRAATPVVPGPTADDIRSRRVTFPSRDPAPVRAPVPPLQALGETRLGAPAAPRPVPASFPFADAPTSAHRPMASTAPSDAPITISSDLTRVGPGFAAQLQRQAHGSCSLFVGSRQWLSVRNRREAETWAFVMDEWAKMQGWETIAVTLAFEAACRRLVALIEVDAGEEWSTMADVELIPAGTILLPDSIRKAMVNRSKVEASRKKSGRGGGKEPDKGPKA